MTEEDRRKWDSRYGSRPIYDVPGPRAWLVDHSDMLTSGRALDIACGTGRNSLFVAQQGYTVDAIDISAEALSRLRKKASMLDVPVNPILADLDTFPLPKSRYDLVMVFYFLSRPLFPAIVDALKPGGVLIYETFNVHFLDVKPDIDRVYLLEPGELCRSFSELEILDYREGASGWDSVSSMVAKKPPTR